MKKLITIIALAGAPLLLAAPDAQAHERHAKHSYHAHAYHRGEMPRALRKHRAFRIWYRDSGLRGNARLHWDELYSIYRWEVRFSNHRRAYKYYRGHNRDYRYYRRYWSEQYKSRHRYGERKYDRHDRNKDKRGKKREQRRRS